MCQSLSAATQLDSSVSPQEAMLAMLDEAMVISVANMAGIGMNDDQIWAVLQDVIKRLNQMVSEVEALTPAPQPQRRAMFTVRVAPHGRKSTKQQCGAGR